MPKFIVSDEQINSYSFSGPIPSEVAKKMKEAFKVPFHVIRVNRKIADDFISELVEMSRNGTVEPGFEVGIRYYMGQMGLSSIFNFVAVPCCAKINIKHSDDHLCDQEKKWLAKTGNRFIAITSQGHISYNANQCKAIVEKKDYKKEKRLVYHPLAMLQKFIDGLERKEDYVILAITFARTDSGNLTLVQECLDSNGNPILSHVEDEKGFKLLASGTAFDEGDLIPPPPPKSSVSGEKDDCPETAWVPDSIFDSEP